MIVAFEEKLFSAVKRILSDQVSLIKTDIGLVYEDSLRQITFEKYSYLC